MDRLWFAYKISKHEASSFSIVTMPPGGDVLGLDKCASSVDEELVVIEERVVRNDDLALGLFVRHQLG